MPKIRLLAPWTNDKGEPQAAGAVIDVSDEQAQDLNGRGQASLVDEEKKLEEQSATSGVYDARLQRPETPSQPSQPQTPSQPQAPSPPEDTPKKK